MTLAPFGDAIFGSTALSETVSLVSVFRQKQEG